MTPVFPRAFRVTDRRRVRRSRSPAAALALTLAALIAVGTVALTLPIASADGGWTPPFTALFTATSAVSVTGLAVVDTGTAWSPAGQVVLLLLIQLGGFGFMTGSTLVLFLVAGRRASLRDRMLAQASTGEQDLGSIRTIVGRIALFSLVVEAIGATVLTLSFILHGREPGQAAWFGIFHAVSAFNNAGFDLFGGFASLAPVADEPITAGAMVVLILLGASGFAIVGDVWVRRRWSALTVETRLVLGTTALLLLSGTAAMLVLEWSNPQTLGADPPLVRPFHAFAETTYLRTAGFSTMPTGALREATLVVIIALMFIGGASGSTAGGIKVNTFAVLLVAILSTVAGRRDAEVFGRRLPADLVQRALAIALLSIAIAFLVSLGMAILVEEGFLATVFETISALGTVGASTGITPILPPGADILLILAMFIGRLGPLTLAIALGSRARPSAVRPAVESMRIG